jgi:hypothetical protein
MGGNHTHVQFLNSINIVEVSPTLLTAVVSVRARICIGFGFNRPARRNTTVTDTRRITLVTRHTQLPERPWEKSADVPSRIVLLDSFTLLRYTVSSSLVSMDADVERIILDRSSSASDFLALLAELPREFSGDVVMIRDDETGFLSSTGRGGDRILYALSADDVRFYLETQQLVIPGSAAFAGKPEREYQVLQFRTRTAVA